MSSGPHSAAASAVGYLYQTQWGLLELLRRAKDRPDHALTLELHDDVAWERDSSPFELLQTKHHVNAAAGLGDKDTDIWKTLLVWMNAGDLSDPQGPALVLVTTSIATAGTAAYALREATRDPSTALRMLIEAARTSTAKATEVARERFLGLGPAEHQAFVARITVADAAPTVDDLDLLVRNELWSSMPMGHEDLFVALLWKWWAEVSLDMLQRRRRAIDVSEARIFISSLRDRFGDDDLPTLIEISDVVGVEEDLVLAHESSPFVHQMRWVGYGPVNLRKAIVDYHRAVVQTTAWVDESLIGLHELQRFEDNLRDEWSRVFEDMLEDLGADADEQAKASAGKQLLRLLRDSTAVTVRARYNEPFFSRGKRHELADGGRIGWHPDFQERLEAVLALT